MNQEAEVALYEPYDAEILAHFKRKLIDEKIQTQGRLQRNSEPIFVEHFQSTERVDKSEFFAKHKSEENNNKGILADIVKALERIEDGSYGICIDCNKRILLARLDAIPAATRCVPCQADKKSGKRR